ncbi:MAG: NAD(+)/NADH kinase [Oligoflexales bacterium]|nr:NAD(+)/NADH kinase [Oligoflexales bacterium]
MSHNVLIITKPTKFELCGEQTINFVMKGFLSQEYLQSLESAHKQHYHLLKVLKDTLEFHSIPFTLISRDDNPPDNQNFDAVFTVGGDGTLLSAARRMDGKIPLIGIRSSDMSLGYLCAGGEREIETIIQRLLQGLLEIKTCSRLRAVIVKADTEHEFLSENALNDMLFANHHPAATSRYLLSFNGRQETHRSSGIWISTATGSTGGITAAGGSQMERTSTHFQFFARELALLTNIEHMLMKGQFDPDVDQFSIVNLSESSVLALDGTRHTYHLKMGDKISFIRGATIPVALPININQK